MKNGDSLIEISIHVSLMGDDILRSDAARLMLAFPSTPPLWGTTLMPLMNTPFRPGFLSTSPSRGTTSWGLSSPQ